MCPKCRYVAYCNDLLRAAYFGKQSRSVPCTRAIHMHVMFCTILSSSVLLLYIRVLFSFVVATLVTSQQYSKHNERCFDCRCNRRLPKTVWISCSLFQYRLPVLTAIASRHWTMSFVKKFIEKWSECLFLSTFVFFAKYAPNTCHIYKSRPNSG